ncbi:hypothetical protein SVIOM342S_09427 [Streptomyces violaceorubidus]
MGARELVERDGERCRLGPAIGMGTAGWLTGLAFAFASWAVLSRALHCSRLPVFGPANRVTLGRATLVGGVTSLVADSFRDAPPVPLLVGLTAVALVLDGVDGKVARRTGTSSPLGARFDMEVDAFLILVLSVYVAIDLGPWVLLIGGMRYVFVAAARVWPWLTAPLPPSAAGKTVAALQGVLLLLAGADLLPRVANAGVVAVALGLPGVVVRAGRAVAVAPVAGARHRCRDGAGTRRPVRCLDAVEALGAAIAWWACG